MGSSRKLSEAFGLVEEKTVSIQERMIMVMRELDSVEAHYKKIQDLSYGRSNELQSKEESLKSFEKSVAKQIHERFDSRRRAIEKGLKKFGEKEKFLRGALEKMEMEGKQSEIMKVSVEKTLTDVLLKEKEFQCLLDELKKIQGQVEKRGAELDSMEETLRCRKDEIDEKEKNLILRVNEVDELERKLERRLHEFDSAEKSRLCELETRENEVISNQKLVEARNFQIDSKKRLLEKRKNALDSEAERLKQREDELDVRAQNLMDLAKQLEAKEEGLGGANNSVSPTKPADVRSVRRKRVSPGHEERKVQENRRQRGKRSSGIPGESIGKIEVQDLQNSGRKTTTQAQMTEDLTELDPEPDLNSLGNFASNPIGDPSFTSDENLDVHQTWACFDAKDRMPRKYARVINLINQDGEVRLEVLWLKPCPEYKGEKEWVEAGLPVSCGEFEPGEISVESPTIFSHLALGILDPVWTILPRQGETWALYRDWDIVKWASHQGLHRHCEYDIVEIPPHPRHQPLFRCISVTLLDRIEGSVKLFTRRSRKDKDSFLIKANSLYRFSHKVPSVQKMCIDENGILHDILELDLNCLPLQLH
ncbi:OLC1v1026267C2 [Oldenlandia corymbosa var. corymbosa]|uniref:OLC1v1026267C2 n=1 Tax=Oldenlandia corymbosa var. corymbosa TaxID=529605 RepID=A0AAV1C9P3_OLDCO|nr:OLC1v1026267C2 [Oldenlandia corymbosa var. corymbosa]